LHPALVIFGVVAGGEIAGPVGMFLSVPAIAALRIIWRRVRTPDDEQGRRAMAVASDAAPEETVWPARRARPGRSIPDEERRGAHAARRGRPPSQAGGKREQATHPRPAPSARHASAGV